MIGFILGILVGAVLMGERDTIQSVVSVLRNKLSHVMTTVAKLLGI